MRNLFGYALLVAAVAAVGPSACKDKSNEKKAQAPKAEEVHKKTAPPAKVEKKAPVTPVQPAKKVTAAKPPVKHPTADGAPRPPAKDAGIAAPPAKAAADTRPGQTKTTQPSSTPPVVPAPVQAPRGPGKGVPDLRLLLTATDVAEMSGGKSGFHRTALPGVIPSDSVDALYYEPDSGSHYGFGIQVYSERRLSRARQKYESLFASYPNSVEVAPVSGKTFFAYWGEVLFVVFVHPQRSLVVALSCGRQYCDSDGIYGLAKKVGSRIK